MCPGCGETYQGFRTGMTFSDVQQSLFVITDDKEQWKRKGRHMVLGKWMEIKKDMWAMHQRECCPHAFETPDETEESIPF